MIYVRLEKERVVEIIEPLILEEKEIPINERFSEDFVKSLVSISDKSIPALGSIRKDGSFVPETYTQTSVFSVDHLRLMAYADPLNGSDRYFSEALALQAEGFTASSAEVKELKQKGLARKEEIKLAYPKP